MQMFFSVGLLLGQILYSSFCGILESDCFYSFGENEECGDEEQEWLSLSASSSEVIPSSQARW